ncbi:MAG TPA: FABP family protein [Lacisediminihabitans sp.]|uniref:FABP family protein n=1 Tax=Lacisediminihabitans sp. TaxID=2787631 RepID=UPI002EDA2F13
MIELPVNLPAELVPLSWLIGVWEGTGLINYDIGDDTRNYEFGQRISFSHDGLPYLNYNSYTWLLDEDHTPLATETGYWRLARPATEGDPGPGMLPGIGARPFTTARSVEALRGSSGGFDIEASILHPGGVSELYIGLVKGPRIDLATDAVMRSVNAKEHTASTRLYGLVENHLLWAWDIAALGQELATHSSGRLARVE